MPLIGTAGHVDHGKSTLIERLTGRDPDRWDEEKRRGLTIDLGFAWTELPDGTEVSFVDVPGHERYLKNMLAGIEAVDVALFVVAADEGWMPQSEEHLAVLDLLDVDRGVVALTKTDIVDDDLVELATLEISDRLLGTGLEGSAIVPVSGTTGAGIEQLLVELERLTGSTLARDAGRPRLWVDRSFTASGAGTIVTGTLLDGSFETGDPVTIYPEGLEARIRGMQTHERSVDLAEPGRRLALNLAGVGQQSVQRGDMIGRVGDWHMTRRFSARIRTARYIDELDRRGAYQLHIGSAVDQARVIALEEESTVLKLREELPIAVGDRFVIRDTGRKLVVAGGRVLDPSPRRARRALHESLRIDPDAAPGQIASTLLELRGIESVTRLAQQTGAGVATGETIGDWVISNAELKRLTGLAIDRVEREHEDHPLRPGMPIATLAGYLDVAPEITELIVERADRLSRTGPDVSVQGREVELSPQAEAEWGKAHDALAEGLAVPTVEELGLDPELLHLKLRRGELTRVSQDLVFLPSQIGRIQEIIGSMPPDFTVADFRDRAGLSRKYAVPILEWADREGLTVRRGDTRTAR